jgi:hypothetical protein
MLPGYGGSVCSVLSCDRPGSRWAAQQRAAGAVLADLVQQRRLDGVRGWAARERAAGSVLTDLLHQVPGRRVSEGVAWQRWRWL